MASQLITIESINSYNSNRETVHGLLRVAQGWVACLCPISAEPGRESITACDDKGRTRSCVFSDLGYGPEAVNPFLCFHGKTYVCTS